MLHSCKLCGRLAFLDAKDLLLCAQVASEIMVRPAGSTSDMWWLCHPSSRLEEPSGDIKRSLHSDARLLLSQTAAVAQTWCSSGSSRLARRLVRHNIVLTRSDRILLHVGRASVCAQLREYLHVWLVLISLPELHMVCPSSSI